MRRFALLLALAVAWRFGPAMAGEPPVDIEIIAGVMDEEEVKRAVEAFRKTCLPLGVSEVWNTDVLDVSATAEPEYAAFRQAKGWPYSLTLAVRLADDLRVLPNWSEGVGVVAGHTLWYTLGFVGQPGFFASKRSSQFACGFKRPSSDDLFREVPAFGKVSR